jgi:hypothetical protein
MELSDKQLEMISELAESAFAPGRIAFMIDVEPEVFRQLIEDIAHPASIAYYKGFYTNENAVRKSIMQLARNGSSPAQTLAMQMIERTKTEMRHEGYQSLGT